MTSDSSAPPDPKSSSPDQPLVTPSRSAPVYALVTPVRNEEKHIGNTIEAVLSQTVQPSEWIIVSDGSTDRTDEIVQAAATRAPWIKLLSLPPRAVPSFAAVVDNTTLGISKLERAYDFLGLLDSDVTFQSDYFEQLIRKFQTEPKLGLAGGVVIDVGTPRDVFPRNRIDVPGAVQFFRRECFAAIGRLIPIPEGGWDGMTCAMARMNGYETRLCTDLVVDHHKPRNISQGGVVSRKFQMGARDYAAGYHPVFEFVKCCSRLSRERPYVVASIAWGLGYLKALATRRKRVIPPDVMNYIRQEQMNRLFRRSL